MGNTQFVKDKDNLICFKMGFWLFSHKLHEHNILYILYEQFNMFAQSNLFVNYSRGPTWE